MGVRLVCTPTGINYNAAVRSVKCTKYPQYLIAQGYTPGVLCFFAGYDQGLPNGNYGNKTALIKIEEANQTLVFKDITNSAGLLWTGGVQGTNWTKFREYFFNTSGGTDWYKYDGLSMMGGAWIDYDKNNLPDLVTVGQHASIRASKMVFDNSKPEGITFNTSILFV